MRTEKKQRLAQLRHWRVRRKISGTKERPRMSVCFTNENIHVQFIDDHAGVTLAAVSTTGKATPDRDKLAANVASAKVVGKLAAETALARGIKTVVFDRGNARYHRSESKGKDGKPVLVFGKLATLAEAARAAGLKF
ncbi:MAG TPA: 50S ribosomal protein L18 [Candidatus Sulfopaludibacter sp.]|nr:50S ribosomal protein L18 [Candidatus Sulfopaludibacter sp.]